MLAKLTSEQKHWKSLKKRKNYKEKLHFSVRESEETLNRKMKSKAIARSQLQ